MAPRQNVIPRLCSATLAATLLVPCRAFTTPSSKREARCRPLPVAISDAIDAVKPRWVPWELAELAAEDMQISQEEFVKTFADVEAYTSCDDEADDFHECDFFGQYLGPTKWLHLTPEARASIDDIHFSIWRDVWSRPHGAVDLADKVSNECLRYYNEFMLEPRPSSIRCPTDRPLIRVKVVPASFGLEGFEDAVWEATEDLMERSVGMHEKAEPDAEGGSRKEGYCRAITFVVAAPDLFADPTLAEGASSPQAEFEPDLFREFASALRGKLAMFSEAEGVPLDDAIRLTPYHPLWKAGDAESDGTSACMPFPYPCVEVSTEIAAE